MYSHIFFFIPGKEDEEDKVETQRSSYTDKESTIFETCCTETTDYATSCCSSDSFHSDKDDEHWTFLANKQSERRPPESKKSERRPPERKSEEIPDSLLVEAFPNVMQRRTNCSPLNSRNGSLPLEERTSEVSENVEAFRWFEDKIGEKTLFQEGYGQQSGNSENEVTSLWGERGLGDKRQNDKEKAVGGPSQKGYGRDCGKTMWTFDLPAEDSADEVIEKMVQMMEKMDSDGGKDHLLKEEEEERTEYKKCSSQDSARSRDNKFHNLTDCQVIVIIVFFLKINLRSYTYPFKIIFFIWSHCYLYQ